MRRPSPVFVMLDQFDFKPSRKLCSFWSSLPQGGFSLGKTKVPPLFSEHRSFFIEYFLFTTLILLEVYTIYFLAHEGVPYIVMAILAGLEILIAILPLLWQNKQNFNKSYVEAQIFVYKIFKKYSDPENQGQYDVLDAAVKKWSSKKRNIVIVNFIFGLIIVGFGYWKFYTYYGIYGQQIFEQLSGRLIFMSIALGVIVHLFVTKTVFLHLLMLSRLGKELNEKSAGNPTYRDLDKGYTMVPITMNFISEPLFIKYHVDNQQDVSSIQNSRAQLLKKADGNNQTVIKSIPGSGGSESGLFSMEENFGSGATFLFTKLLRDEDVKRVIDVQHDVFEGEIIAAVGKKQQLDRI